MIVYRPIAPLTVGSSGLMSALVAMASTAVIGSPTWQNPGGTAYGTSHGAVSERAGDPAPVPEAVTAGKRRPQRP